jgi:hypothetical protein
MARFMVADMTRRLPFPDEGFDAVMSNVALHMFPDRVTRAVFAEVGRLVRAGGLFVFHVNALEDRPLRARHLPARELEPDYVAEESARQCTSSPRPTCANSWEDGRRWIWSRSRFRIARAVSCSSMSGAAWPAAEPVRMVFCRPGLVRNLSDREKRTRRSATCQSDQGSNVAQVGFQVEVASGSAWTASASDLARLKVTRPCVAAAAWFPDTVISDFYQASAHLIGCSCCRGRCGGCREGSRRR